MLEVSIMLSVRLTEEEQQRLIRLKQITGLKKGTVIKMGLPDTLDRLEKVYGLAT
jgi:predicted DNA-binding protein